MLPEQIIACLALGFAAGLLGGLAGVGGSMVMLPGLGLIFGYPASSDHHLYMGAAMTVNFAVALPAAARHRRAGAIRKDLLRNLLLTTTVFMLVGVAASNMFEGDWLKKLLAAFLFVYCVVNVKRIVRPAGYTEADARTSTARVAISGSSTGFVGGLLGLGGGVMLVPMLQVLCRIPLRQSIATSSAVICITAVIGAGAKLATLYQHQQSWERALYLAAIMAPAAMIGAPIGAGLTHRLPIRWVRVAITVLLLGASARLAGLLG